MELSVIERLTLQDLLPAKGSYTNLKLLRMARETLSFSDEEHKLLNFRQEGEGDTMRTIWNVQHLVDKNTNKPIQGENAFVQKMVNANPEGYEMRPVLKDKEIDLGEVIVQIISRSLIDLEKAEKLEERHFSLYEKFVLIKESNLEIVK